MDDDFWKQLSARLTALRKRKAVLSALTGVLGVGAIFALLVANTAMNEVGSTSYLQWPALIVSSGCVLSMIAIFAYMEQDS
jgi:hypothetical protein